MSLKSSLAISLAFVAAAAFAQPTQLGSVAAVQGLVTVTDGTTGGVAAAGNPILDGMRFVATSNGSAVLRLNNGCVVRLEAGQAVTVLRSMTCPELLAAVQRAGGASVAGGGSFGRGALAGGGLVVGGYALSRSLTRKGSLSSN